MLTSANTSRTERSVLEAAVGQPIVHFEDLRLTPRLLASEGEEADLIVGQIDFTTNQAVGPDLAAGPAVAQPPGALRGGSGQGQDPLLHAAAQGPGQSNTDPGSGLSAAQPGLPGLIGLFGMYWHLSACAQFTVRDVLALTPLHLDGNLRRCGGPEQVTAGDVHARRGLFVRSSGG